MSRLLKVGLLLLIAYGGWQHFQKSSDGQIAQKHEKVIMYSQTTCGYCVEKKRELLNAGIRFSEYYIDKNPARKSELGEKLKQAGYPPRAYGTPILDVHGYMLPNNPSLSEIRKRMNMSDS